MRLRQPVWRGLFFSAIWLALGAVAGAQMPPEPPAETPALREQTIYIPYSKLRETFEKHGRGVFLPYDKFQELWKAARDKETSPAPAEAPVKSLITEVASEAVVADQVVNVTAEVKIDLLTPGWHEIPLRLGDAAIRSAEIAGQPARLISSADGGYALLVEKKGEAAESITLALEYARGFTKSPGQNSVSFSPPLAPVNRWKIRVPESGVRVNVQPMLASTEAPQDDEAQETVVMAFVGAAPVVRVDWTPHSEGAAGLEALASVQAQQEVVIEQGLIRTRTRLAYEISRAELSQLVIEVSADQKVAGVFDPNVRQWSVAAEGDQQRITAELFQPAKTVQQVIVELEKFVPEAEQQTVTAPLVKAIGVSRQQGFVVVRMSDGLRAEVTNRQGLAQSDLSDMPAQLKQGEWTFAYRYAALPYELELAVEQVQPRIEVAQLIEARLEPEKLTLDLLALYTIERAGVFELMVDVPAGFEVRQVRGHASNGAEAAVVDAYHVEGENNTNLRVNLGRKALGKIGLHVQLERRLQDPNLLSPTGQSSELALPLPRVAPQSVERSSGRLIVYGPESLRLSPAQAAGLRSVSFQEALANFDSICGAAPAGLRPVLAYAFAEEPVELTLTAERRKPFITARQLLVARVDAGVVKYEATIVYNILYSGVKSLRLDVPAALASQIHNVTGSIRDKVIDPPPADLLKGYVAWSLTGESELLGDVTVKLAWERPIEKIDVGKSVDLPLPVLKPGDVERAWGQIVIVKAETLDVNPAGEPQGLRPIDPQHDLMPGASVPDAALAFEFQDDWTLTVTATRYQLETVKRTSIERAVVRMVVTRSDQISVQALYRLRSAHQRLAVQLPSGVAFDTEPLRINGRPVALERGDKDEFYAPLVGHSPSEPLVLELRYTLPGDASRLELPTFPDDPAVQKVYLCAYLPQETAWLGARGPWNDEQQWRFTGSHFAARPQRSDSELVNWVTEGIDAGNPLAQFQTDGRLYVYSTLRPAAPPDGTLRLTTLNDNWLSALVFLGVVAIGVALLRYKFSRRLVVLAGLTALLVVLGVFLPTFSHQLWDGVLFAALVVVGLIWLGVALLNRPPRVARTEPVAVEASEAEPPASPLPSPPSDDEGGPTHV